MYITKFKILYISLLTLTGLPNQFKTDNRTVFNYNKINEDKRTYDKDVLTPRKIDNGNSIKYKNQ